MPEQAIVHDTFVIARSFAKPPEKVFAALSDPAKKQRWYGAGQQNMQTFKMDFRPGGAETATYRMGDNTPFPGAELAHEGRLLDIVPNKRVVIASTMALAGHRMSASLCSFELIATANGTDLVFTHQGAFFENADGPQMRKDGWNALLDQLVKDVAA